MSPASRGSLTLNSTNPFVQPLLNPGILADDFDLITMREAIKAGAAFANASSFSDFLVEPIGPYATALQGGDAAIEAYAKNLTTTVWHITSSLSMTSEKSTDGALNPDLTVKGTSGLRVVDASAFVRRRCFPWLNVFANVVYSPTFLLHTLRRLCISSRSVLLTSSRVKAPSAVRVRLRLRPLRPLASAHRSSALSLALDISSDL